jgi:hypothetical protein
MKLILRIGNVAVRKLNKLGGLKIPAQYWFLSMKNHLILLLVFFLLLSCQNKNSQCKDVYPEKRFSGTGYIFFLRSSQDGMGDFWFFPSCNRPKSNDIFLNSDFKKGVSFKLPLTGAMYKKLSKSFESVVLEEGSFSKKIWFTPIFIDFDKTKQSLIHSSLNNNNLTLHLNSKNSHLVLSYFVTEEITINQIGTFL